MINKEKLFCEIRMEWYGLYIPESVFICCIAISFEVNIVSQFGAVIANILVFFQFVTFVTFTLI